MRTARILIALALFITAGIVHGSWTNRWKPSGALADLVGRIDRVPLELEGWETDTFELSDRELAGAGALGSLARRYAHLEAGIPITVLLVAGLPSDIASHTPDVCYPGSGFVLSPPALLETEVGDPPAPVTMRTSIARRETPDGQESLRIFWLWNDGTGWKAPDDPRWSFSAVPALSKLYLVRDATGERGDGTRDDDPALGLARSLLPALDRALFSHEPT